MSHVDNVVALNSFVDYWTKEEDADFKRRGPHAYFKAHVAYVWKTDKFIGVLDVTTQRDSSDPGTVDLVFEGTALAQTEAHKFFDARYGTFSYSSSTNTLTISNISNRAGIGTYTVTITPVYKSS